MHKKIKQFNSSKTLRELSKKYKIPFEYTSSSRRMLIRGIVIGIFVALLPIPFQMLVILALMGFFRFNVLIGLVMCWITNPLTMPIIYYFEYKVGTFILGQESKELELTTEWFLTNFDNILTPLFVGSFFIAISFSFLLFFLLHFLWFISVMKYRNKKNNYFKW